MILIYHQINQSMNDGQMRPTSLAGASSSPIESPAFLAPVGEPFAKTRGG